MSIKFNYEIINVNEPAKAMEIVYTAEGREPMHIGARMPYEGESLETIVKMFSPVAIWLSQDAAVTPVSAGTKGSIDPTAIVTPSTVAEAKAQKVAEIAAWRYAKEIAGIAFEGMAIGTSREAQAALYAAKDALSSDYVSSIDWKLADGSFASFDAAKLTAIAQAVFAHVQSCFTLEKQYLEMLAGCATIDAVLALALPA
jgi:hypothetical protein